MRRSAAARRWTARSRRRLLQCEVEAVGEQRHTGRTCNGGNEILGYLRRDDHPTAGPTAKIRVDPPHVIEKLTQRPIAPPRELQLDNNEFVFAIDEQKVDTAVVDGKFHAFAFTGGVETEAGLDDVR